MSTVDIQEQAAHWVDRINDPREPLTSAEQDAFQEWIAANEAHAREFEAINRIVTITAELPVADQARLSEWASKHREPEDRTHSRRQVMRYALAATVTAAVVGSGYYAISNRLFGGETYVTRTGQTLTANFKEGSVAYLNTRTELRWIGTEDDRLVELLEGEALFDVVHDDARPFRVKLDNSEIRVLGTRFNVYLKPNGNTAVTVLEGTVEVRGYGDGSANTEWVRRLEADQQIEYSTIGLVREPHAMQAQKAAQWRSGIYKFEDERIEDVLNELTRYTDKRIVIRDPRIADKRIGGRLSTRDIRDSLTKMQGLAPIQVNENNNTFTLDYRAEDAPRKD